MLRLNLFFAYCLVEIVFSQNEKSPERRVPQKRFFADPCPDGFTDISAHEYVEFESGNCIRILEKNKYAEAEEECKGLGGHLARPMSEEHNRLIALQGSSAFQDGKVDSNVMRPMWIGYSDRDEEGSFADSEGNPPMISFWAANQPDNTIGRPCRKLEGQNCAIVNHGLSAYWDDVWCCQKFHAVCQTKRLALDDEEDLDAFIFDEDAFDWTFSTDTFSDSFSDTFSFSDESDISDVDDSEQLYQNNSIHDQDLYCPGSSKCWTLDNESNTCLLDESCYSLECKDYNITLSFSPDIFRVDISEFDPWIKLDTHASPVYSVEDEKWLLECPLEGCNMEINEIVTYDQRYDKTYDQRFLDFTVRIGKSQYRHVPNRNGSPVELIMGDAIDEVSFTCRYERTVRVEGESFVASIESSSNSNTGSNIGNHNNSDNGKTTEAQLVAARRSYQVLSNGNLGQAFAMSTFSSESFDIPVSVENPVLIGSEIFVKIDWNFGRTSERIEFLIDSCFVEVGEQQIDLVLNNCYSHALGAQLLNEKFDKSSVKFKYRVFAPSASSESVTTWVYQYNLIFFFKLLINYSL